MKVLVADKTSEEGLKILRTHGFEVDVKTGLSEDEIIKIIPQYEALIVRSATKVTKGIIEQADRLKLIGRAGVGVDNIDVEAATQKGIIVMNAPTGNTISAAEHTVAMILAISRNIPQAHISLKNNQWFKKKYTGTEVYGKTLGVIGFGKIGSEVAKRMHAFGMTILVYDPYLSVDSIKSTEFTLIEKLEELLKQSDYITIHTPKQDRYLIDFKEFELMKKDVYLINVARGGIVNEQALYQALKENRIRGAALDVFEKEPKVEGSVFDNRLRELDNVIFTPHLGASTSDAQDRVAIDIANQFVDYWQNHIIRNAVNIPTADPQTRPYLPLAEQLGSLASQLSDGHIEEVTIGCYGQLASFDTKMIALAALKGLLNFFVESANYVNAPYLAKERNIAVIEFKSEKVANYVNLIRVQVKSGQDSNKVSGTLFESNQARIVEIDDFRLDLIPSQYHAFIEHRDVPGVVGKVGTLLGENNINIDEMSVGKMGKQKTAMMALSIDKPIPEALSEKIKQIPEIYQVKSVKLEPGSLSF